MKADSTFIAPADFAEGQDGLRLDMPPPETFGHSTFTGLLSIANIERCTVEQMLPKGIGLTLAANVKHPDLHPVLQVAGLQGETGWSLPHGANHQETEDYHEFILFIPFVLRPQDLQWHNFVVRMYLNNEIAMQIGELFAYRKKIGFVRFDDPVGEGSPGDRLTLRVETAGGVSAYDSEDTLDGVFTGSAAAATRDLPNFSDMVRILGMPLLGVDPGTNHEFCSYLDLDFRRASVQSTVSEFQYAAGFDPPTLAPSMRTSVEGGAIFVRDVAWKLQFPPKATAPRPAAPVRASPPTCAGCLYPLPAAARFCPHCGVAVTAAVPMDTPFAQDGERRQASVVFVDLIGSTALASTMDPEALRQLLRHFRTTIDRVVTQYFGTIAQYFGDGVLIFFGYPTAREDSTEHAVGAAIDIVEQVRADDASGRLRVRVGVATGIVVTVGQNDPSGSLGDVAVGGPSWLAARLQSVAPVDGVVIANETWMLAGHLFDCRAMGNQALRGYATEVPAWLVLGRKRAVGRFEARRGARDPLPIIGRDIELATLLDTWRRVKESGKCAIVAVVGDAGIGKSRLVEALYERIAPEAFVPLQYHCAARYRNTELYPVIAQIERAAGLERDDTPHAKMAKLEAMLEQSSAPESLATSVGYIASLLSVPFGRPYPPLPESPERRKEGLLSTLERHLVALAGGGPLLLLVEDWHWSDPSTQELIKRVSSMFAGRPTMIVLTSRTDIAADWAGVESITIRVDRLSDEYCEPLIALIVRGRPMAPRVVEQVLRKADGVPLYIEEITRSLDEAGALGGGDPDDTASPSIAVPNTLRDLMQSRLDSLARAKEVAQLGAAVGREFSYGLLRALQESDSDLLRTLHQSSESDLRAALNALVTADIVQREGTYPEARFHFRHALIQDAAYETMLLGVRPGVHREIAKALQASSPGIAEIRPEVLAHHFAEAGDMREAHVSYHQAGLRAASRAANIEAGEHFRAAIDCLATLPDNAERQQHELMSLIELGLAITALKGYAAAEVIAVYERARRLCASLGTDAALFPVLRGLCTFYMVRAEFETALDLARECERIADASGRPDHRIEALAAGGYTLVYLGRLSEGREQLEQAIAAYRTASDEYATSLTVRHGVMAALALLAIVVWMQGEHEYAARCSQSSTELADATGRPFDIAYASCFAAMLANFQGDTAKASHYADLGIARATEHAFKDWLMAGVAQSAIAGILRGKALQSRDILEAAARQWQASGAELNRHVFIAGHAAAMLATFNIAGARTRVDEAIAHAEQFHEHWLDAEMHRLRGMILEFSPNANAEAADAYRRAVHIALAQQAPYLALRSAVRLWAIDRNSAHAAETAQLMELIGASLPVDAHASAEYAIARKLLAHPVP